MTSTWSNFSVGSQLQTYEGQPVQFRAQQWWFFWSVSALYCPTSFGTARYFAASGCSSEHCTLYFNMERQMALYYLKCVHKYCKWKSSVATPAINAISGFRYLLKVTHFQTEILLCMLTIQFWTSSVPEVAVSCLSLRYTVCNVPSPASNVVYLWSPWGWRNSGQLVLMAACHFPDDGLCLFTNNIHRILCSPYFLSLKQLLMHIHP